MASKLNNYFLNVAKNLLKDTGESHNEFLLKIQMSTIFFINETDPIEASDLLDKINVNKATNIYCIPPKLVITVAGKLKDNLTLIFNYSITIPEKLKTGLIFPIHKGEPKFACSNYHPISILLLFSKISEKLMCTGLTDFINKNELLFQHQFSYEKGK